MLRPLEKGGGLLIYIEQSTNRVSLQDLEVVSVQPALSTESPCMSIARLSRI